MIPSPQHTPGDAALGEAPDGGPELHDVALEPSQAWSLKGVGEADEVIIPGLLLDDLGGCTSVEASMSLATFHQLLAMASMQDSRMLAARSMAEPDRLHPEANVWSVEGRLVRRRLSVHAIHALDRVVVDAYGTRLSETMRPSQLIPGARAWR